MIGIAGCAVTTPDVDVRVTESTDVRETGLRPYPGARLKNASDEDHKAGKVEMSAPVFGLKIVSVKYQTKDPADKVLAFYRSEMSKYGKVRGQKGELRAGPDDDLRVVTVKPAGAETEITLVYAWAAEPDPK